MIMKRTLLCLLSTVDYSLITMSCFPRAECLEAGSTIQLKGSGTPDEKEPDHEADAMRQTGKGYFDRTKCSSRAKIYRTCISPLGAECFPVAPWQLCSGADSDPGSCGWRAHRWMDFILLPLPPDLWRAWETWGSLFWMINITPPPFPNDSAWCWVNFSVDS